MSVTDSPAIALPSNPDADGAPVGVQLVGRPRRDADLLAPAARLEAAHLWDDTHPSCWYA